MFSVRDGSRSSLFCSNFIFIESEIYASFLASCYWVDTSIRSSIWRFLNERLFFCSTQLSHLREYND